MHMFSPTQILIRQFQDHLAESYKEMYGGLRAEYGEILRWAGAMALEIISSSDALYHNLEHTIFVTCAGMEILRGKHIKEGLVSPEDWMMQVIALLCHDIGYVKGLCRQDNVKEGVYATGVNGGLATLPAEATGASLTPYHVDRGKLFVLERFQNHPLIKADVIAQRIELTRFPVPRDDDHADCIGYAGLVRAADLIGQLADPAYTVKIPALFAEFAETGSATKLGYRNCDDLRKGYPSFFWGVVHHYIEPAMEYLRVTHNGRQILASLFSHVFTVEHNM